jgi:adenosyl cobinamide kinase/adenosyl cobinamide phosphate guanylyltransferase
MTLTLLIGGARSGKSRLAVDHARRWPGPVTFIATAPRSATGGNDVAHSPPDPDLEQRIARHAAERPTAWATIEETVDLQQALRRAGAGLVIIDCLTLWTSNLMAAGEPDEAIRARAERTAALAAARPEPVVTITNEVGMGVHPETTLGLRYRDVHGWVNQAWAEVAHTALLLVAGRAVRLDPARDHLDVAIGLPPAEGI